MVSRGYTLSDLVGYKFESVVHGRYPSLVWNSKGSGLPDFTGRGFYLEAKGQCAEYGGRIQPYQVERFRDLDMPVFYIYGWHNVKGLAKLKRATAVRKVAQLNFGDLCLLDNELIEKFFRREQRFAHAQKPNGNNHYCVLKPRHIRQIMSNELIERGGSWIKALEFYGIDPARWVFDEVNGITRLVKKELISVAEVLCK